MTIKADWAELAENNEIAFLKADVCLGSPESFSLEEKATICDEMEATNKAIEDAVRRDFEAKWIAIHFASKAALHMGSSNMIVRGASPTKSAGTKMAP